ncbi:MAG: hypothetical protein LBB79_04390 [Prevotellaceae bacterium]|nr:hypothetical protein [Prevotellaceae bacterium]
MNAISKSRRDGMLVETHTRTSRAEPAPSAVAVGRRPTLMISPFQGRGRRGRASPRRSLTCGYEKSAFQAAATVRSAAP